MLVDLPRPVSREDYLAAIDRMTARLAGAPGVRAVYQIGGINAPGISDIDLVAIIDDGSAFPGDPLAGLSPTDRYLFIHRLFGTSVTLFARSHDFWFYHDYRLLWGEPLSISEPALAPADVERVKAQVAFEFLAKLFMIASIHESYQIAKVRGLLLLVNAIRVDLEFLGIGSGSLYDHTHRIVEWRRRWFENPPSGEEVRQAIRALRSALAGVLAGDRVRQRGYLPSDAPLRVVRNVSLRAGDELRVRRRGVRLPVGFALLLGRRYFTAQNRLNRFFIELPVAGSGFPTVLAHRFELIREMGLFNQRCMPHFARLPTALRF